MIYCLIKFNFSTQHFVLLLRWDGLGVQWFSTFYRTILIFKIPKIILSLTIVTSTQKNRDVKVKNGKIA